MLIKIPNVLTAAQVEEARAILDAADWVDGKVTAGHQSAKAKDNMQLPEGSPAAKQLGAMILEALGKNPLFLSSALPLKVFPPLFNRYTGGQSFGTHVDNAIRQVPGTVHRRHLWRAAREAACGAHGALSLHQPASRDAGDAWGAHLLILLAAEHDP